MKILHLVDSGGLYGAESVILTLSREMIRNGTFKPVIGCIVSRSNEQSDLFDRAREFGIPTVRVVIRNTRLPIDLTKFLFQCRKLGISLIHSHGYKPSVFAFIIRLISGIQVTATCHLWFMGDKRPLKQRVMTRMELFCYRFYPFITAVSQPIKSFLLKKGVQQQRVAVIKNGIFMEDYPRKRTFSHPQRETLNGNASNESLVSWMLPETKKDIILNVGRLSPQKNQKSILHAAKQLKEEGHALLYFIVGEGEQRPLLEQQIIAQGLKKDVFMPGFCNDVNQLLKRASIFVLPSLDEGMPISLLEAVAVGIPVIVSPVGDIPELIVHGKTGLVVAPEDVNALSHGIDFILTHPEKASEMARRARLLLKKQFSSQAMYQYYTQVYEKYRKINNKKGNNP